MLCIVLNVENSAANIRKIPDLKELTFWLKRETNKQKTQITKWDRTYVSRWSVIIGKNEAGQRGVVLSFWDAAFLGMVARWDRSSVSVKQSDLSKQINILHYWVSKDLKTAFKMLKVSHIRTESLELQATKVFIQKSQTTLVFSKECFFMQIGLNIMPFHCSLTRSTPSHRYPSV